MKAFYSDTFVLPLPEHHRFPMAKYRLLRERIALDALIAAADLAIAEPIDWDDLRLVHDASYVDAVANGTLSAEAQRRIEAAGRIGRRDEHRQQRGSGQRGGDAAAASGPRQRTWSHAWRGRVRCTGRGPELPAARRR